MTLCTQANTSRNGVPRAIVDSLRSFPSGHAQLSCYTSMFAFVRKFQSMIKFRQQLSLLGLHSENLERITEAIAKNDSCFGLVNLLCVRTVCVGEQNH